MTDRTRIEWTDATWNPLRGCSRVSEGCRNCYAERVAARFCGPGQPYAGLVERTPKGPRWTGKVALVESALDQPLRWRKPRRIFVNSMSDLFHEDVPDEWIDRVFAVMALAPMHTFQVLTKRPERMRWYMTRIMEGENGSEDIVDAAVRVTGSPCAAHVEDIDWPLPNVWLGTSVEDQPTADARIPHLLATQAAVRFVSAEPLLGPVDLYGGDPDPRLGGVEAGEGVSLTEFWRADGSGPVPGIDWVIVGGESGPGARPMHSDWARSLRDQCAAAGVPFFFKQWGEWVGAAIYSEGDRGGLTRSQAGDPFPGAPSHWWSGDCWGGVASLRVGKRAAGRLLDGRTNDAMPEPRA